MFLRAVCAWAVFVDSDVATFKPSCVFLDYLLLREKVTLGDEQITILPETYARQQAQLAIVLGKIAVPDLASHRNIFYSLDQASVTPAREVYT